MLTVNPDEARELVVSAIAHNVQCAIEGQPWERRICVRLEGPPGVGKTTLVNEAGPIFMERHGDLVDEAVRELGADEKYRTLTVILAQTEATDIAGWPWVVQEDGRPVMTRAKQPWILSNGFNTVHFDEATKARQDTINAVAQCLLEGRVGDHEFNPLTSFVMSCNRREDRAGDQPLPAHVIDRTVEVAVGVDVDAWLIRAMERGLHPAVVFFVQNAKQFFGAKDESSKAQPTPRSYEKLSDAIASGHFTGTALRVLIEGMIGSAAGSAFHAFLELRDQMVPSSVIFADPENAPIPENPEAVFAVLSNIAYDVSRKNIDAFVKYIDRVEAASPRAVESIAFAMSYVIRNKPDVRRTKPMKQLAVRYAIKKGG